MRVASASLGRLLLCGLAFTAPAAAQLTADQASVLAQRFRPYLKTTLDNGGDEPFHPARWQWIVARSNLFRGGVIVVPNTRLANDFLALADPQFGGNFSLNGAGMSDPGLELSLTGADATRGEPWSDVIHQGHGLYAHVEAVTDNIVNIEYTVVWPRNASSVSNHDGDLTTMIVVYDAAADRLARVTYSIHGCALQAYQLLEPRTVKYAPLGGKDENLADRQIEVARVDVSTSNAGKLATGNCAGLSGSDAYVLLAQDPGSRLYEHPAAFAEVGSHELWPNGTGSVASPAHDGNGVSFLPDRVNVLGTLANPSSEDFPFIFYNGKFGDDPEAIVLHKSWFWPQGRERNGFIDVSRFTDLDPYGPIGSLRWPPAFSGVGSGVAFVSPRSRGGSNASFDGSPGSPFQGLALAYSVTPGGSTLRLAPGNYPGPILLRRKMVLAANGGPVVIGGPP